MNAKELREKFAANGLASTVVDIDGVGRVLVRELTLGDLDSVDYENTARARAHNVALAIHTEDGTERVFDPDNDDDISILLGLGNRVINRISTALAEKN